VVKVMCMSVWWKILDHQVWKPGDLDWGLWHVPGVRVRITLSLMGPDRVKVGMYYKGENS